jgi:hypothetical protein
LGINVWDNWNVIIRDSRVDIWSINGRSNGEQMTGIPSDIGIMLLVIVAFVAVYAWSSGYLP